MADVMKAPSTEFVSRPREDERRTRAKLAWWDRSKILILLASLFFFFVWIETSNNPLLPVSEAFRTTFRLKWWLPALFGLELVRQLHFVLAEHWSAYYFWWQRRFAHNDARIERISPWTRFRIARVAKVLFWIAVVNAFVAWRNQETFLRQLVDLPSTVSDFLLGTAQEIPLIFTLMLSGVLIIGQFALLFWFMARGGTEVYMPDDIKTRFSDVWGQDAVMEKVQENLVLLEDPQSIESRGGHVPSGILLYGPPGTGKTLMAEAVAGETGKPYVFVEPGAFMNMFMGVGVLKVRSLFKKLRKLAMKFGGVIVFFDEADALGNRGSATGGAPAARPAHEHACNGFSYLSDSTRDRLRESALHTTPATPEPDDRGWINRVVMGGLSTGGGDPMALQALLAELSGLKKPRGFVNRHVRRVLGMRPKPPPKYRILIMMATNRADSLDSALLRPGRVDRIYKVGYPSKDGRKRTFEGYLSRVKNVLTDADLEQLAVTSPYATGATIKDTVNEALIAAIRDGRDTVTWPDVLKAKHQKLHGLPDDFEYIERERHAVAIHEACHAIGAYRLKRGIAVDVATIERRGDTGGFVSYIPLEDRFSAWKTDREADIMVSLASLAGERMFFDGDNSTGVGGDMGQATSVAIEMEGRHAMGAGIAARDVTELKAADTSLANRVESRLEGLLERTREMLERDRIWVLAVAHALEQHRTIPGEDIGAIVDGRQGAVVDGRVYHDPVFQARLEEYHEVALAAHRAMSSVDMVLPDASVLGVMPPSNGHGVPVPGVPAPAVASGGAPVAVSPPPPAAPPAAPPYAPPSYPQPVVEAGAPAFEPYAAPKAEPYSPPTEGFELLRAVPPPESDDDGNGNGRRRRSRGNGNGSRAKGDDANGNGSTNGA